MRVEESKGEGALSLPNHAAAAPIKDCHKQTITENLSFRLCKI
jgi:hypothetical protein